VRLDVIEVSDAVMDDDRAGRSQCRDVCVRADDALRAIEHGGDQ
jgi:hypothetical protein